MGKVTNKTGKGRTDSVDQDGPKMCNQCDLSIRDSKYLECDICSKLLHTSCAGFTHTVFDKFMELRHVTGWVCQDCRNEANIKYNKLLAAQSALAEQVCELKAAIDEIKADLAKKPDQPSYTQVLTSAPFKSNIQREVRSAVKDVDRRCRNVVISGVAPNPTLDDCEVVKSLLEEELNLKPYIDRDSCKRIGRAAAAPTGTPRKILVTLRSPADAADILKVAKNLRLSTDPTVKSNIYINKDLSPEEAKAAYEKREKRRADKLAASSGPATVGTSSSSSN